MDTSARTAGWLRTLSRRLAHAAGRPASGPAAPLQRSTNGHDRDLPELRPAPGLEGGYQVTLEYPPTADLSPRWGYDRPPHSALLERLASGDANYGLALDVIAGFIYQLAAIKPSASDPQEPSWVNGFLPGLDGAALYAFTRDRTPRHYLEIGSGNSTKFVARAKRDGALDTTIVSIDPEPRDTVDQLCDELIRRPLETAGLDPFTTLEPGDIVFFDGSHRVFMNSDATVFFLDVLPTLPSGTLVGVHDIFLPDDYPPQWSGRHYSEQYLLAAYLLADCHWLTPYLPAWYVSGHPDLGGRLNRLWEDPRFRDVQRHGGTFWMHVTDRSRPS